MIPSSLGIEFVARAAVWQLFASLNTEIALQASVWAQRDTDFDAATGLQISPVALEPIPFGEIHMGHVPELINAPVERYPNVSVMGVQTTPAEGTDQTEEFQTLLAVEVMVKSLESQEHANRRILRTVDAVNNVFMHDPTLGGVLDSYRAGLKINTVNVSDVFIHRRYQGREDIFWWQGARIDYNCRTTTSYLHT